MKMSSRSNSGHDLIRLACNIRPLLRLPNSMNHSAVYGGSWKSCLGASGILKPTNYNGLGDLRVRGECRHDLPLIKVWQNEKSLLRHIIRQIYPGIIKWRHDLAQELPKQRVANYSRYTIRALSKS